MSNYTGVDNLEVMAEAVNYNSYLVTLISRFAHKDGVTVDFGAGSGTFAKILKNLGYKIICIEPDGFLSEEVKKDGIPVLPHIGLLKEKVSSIYSLNVLEHIEDDVSAISSLYESLMPEGVVTIYVPAFQILYTSMDRKVGHFRRYRRRDLTNKMQNAGFEIISAQYVDSLGFIAAIIYKLIGNRNGEISKKSIIVYDKIIFPISKMLDKLIFNRFGKNIVVYARKSRV